MAQETAAVEREKWQNVVQAVEALLDGRCDTAPADPETVKRLPDWLLLEMQGWILDVVAVMHAARSIPCDLLTLSDEDLIALDVAFDSLSASSEVIVAEAKARGLLCPGCESIVADRYGRDVTECPNCGTPLGPGSKKGFCGLAFIKHD